MSENADPFLKKYVPVDTDLVDNLEHYASDKIHVQIHYKDHTGTAQEMRGLIGDVYTKEHQEFLKMVDGREIRLDQITEVISKKH